MRTLLGCCLVFVVAVIVGCGRGGGGTPDGGGAGGGGTGPGGSGGGSGGAASAVTTRYQVTVDQTALGSLPPSCFVNGVVPTTTTPPPTRVLSQHWDVIAAPGQTFLHVLAPTSFPLGDAEPVILDGILTGADGGFPEQVQVDRTLPNPASANPNFSDTEVKRVHVVISSFANGLTGTLPFKAGLR